MRGGASRMLAALVILALGMVVSGARAGTECVTYQVTARVVGTRQGSRCVSLPPAFDFPYSAQNCQGVPPLGFSECAGADIHLFLP